MQLSFIFRCMKHRNGSRRDFQRFIPLHFSSSPPFPFSNQMERQTLTHPKQQKAFFILLSNQIRHFPCRLPLSFQLPFPILTRAQEIWLPAKKAPSDTTSKPGSLVNLAWMEKVGHKSTCTHIKIVDCQPHCITPTGASIHKLHAFVPRNSEVKKWRFWTQKSTAFSHPALSSIFWYFQSVNMAWKSMQGRQRRALPEKSLHSNGNGLESCSWRCNFHSVGSSGWPTAYSSVTILNKISRWPIHCTGISIILLCTYNVFVVSSDIPCIGPPGWQHKIGFWACPRASIIRQPSPEVAFMAWFHVQYCCLVKQETFSLFALPPLTDLSFLGSWQWHFVVKEQSHDNILF